MNENSIDAIQLNFNQDNVFILNICLALIMYGVALDLKPKDFIDVVKFPKAVLLGLFSQFLMLPFLTFLIILALKPHASIALGMMLVAACPGGNVSNFMTSLSKGNTALSVTLTAFSTALCIFFTPFNLSFWASQYQPTALLLREIAVDSQEVTKTIAILLGIPLVFGMLTRHFFPSYALKLQAFIKPTSILIFILLIVGALSANFDNILNHLSLVIFLVVFHNAVALITGYTIGTLGGLSLADRKSLTIETGIQNSGLGLLLIFAYFSGLGGMALITACWGIWHLISGMALASYWGGIKLPRFVRSYF
jgi:BASS family bile acid:Na+ symporter